MPDHSPKPIGYLLNTWQFVAEIKDQRALDQRGAKCEPLYSSLQYEAVAEMNRHLSEKVASLQNEITLLESQFFRITESF